VGLCPADGVPLDNGGRYTPSLAQEWLWERWCQFCAQVKATTANAHVTLLMNGDLVDGPLHHGTAESIAPHPGAEVDCFHLAIAPLLAINPHALVVVRGTESHVGKSGAVEEYIATQLRTQGYPVVRDEKRKVNSWYQWTGDFGNVRIDATHHGRVGMLPWSRPGTIANNAAREFYAYAATKRRHPDIGIRSHYHKVGDSYDAHPIRIIQTPAWQLATAYTHRIASAEHADIGGIVLTITPGEPVEVVKHLYPPTERTVWLAPTISRQTTFSPRSSRRVPSPRAGKVSVSKKSSRPRGRRNVSSNGSSAKGSRMARSDGPPK
jgi:hypothetical protein